MEPQPPDGVSLRRWFLAYGLYVAALAIPIALMFISLGDQRWAFMRVDHWGAFTEPRHQALKLLVVTLYLSFCCTFLPLPTGWVPVFTAMQATALATGLWPTALLIASAGAVGSTMANLMDYHLLTWMLRSDRVAKVRQKKTYQVSARWFARAPFAILVIFNIIPIPVDVVRLLATTARYPRPPFAAANFIGRFIRYGLLAGLTYAFNWKWKAVLAMLGIAAGLALARVAINGLKKMFAPPA